MMTIQLHLKVVCVKYTFTMSYSFEKAFENRWYELRLSCGVSLKREVMS